MSSPPKPWGNGNHLMPGLIQAAKHLPLRSGFPSTRYIPHTATLILGVKDMLNGVALFRRKFSLRLESGI